MPAINSKQSPVEDPDASPHVKFVRVSWSPSPVYRAFMSEIKSLSSGIVSSPQAAAEAYQIFKKYALIDDLEVLSSPGHHIPNPDHQTIKNLLRYTKDLEIEQGPAAIAEKLLADAIREDKPELIRLILERGGALDNAYSRIHTLHAALPSPSRYTEDELQHTSDTQNSG